MSIAEDWAGLTAEGVRDGAGLKLLHAFRAAFAEWVSKQGIAEAAANTLIALATNRNALVLQQATTKEKVKARLEAFAADLSEEDLTKFMRPLESATAACAQTVDALDF
jgi:diketogulonate reductase-like aldo/keto reductase